MRPTSIIAAIAITATPAWAAPVEVEAGSYNMDATGNSEINVNGFSTGNRVFSFVPTEAGTLGTLSTLIQRRGDVSGTLTVSLFDAGVPETDPSPVLATRSTAIDGFAQQVQGAQTLADFTLVSFDFSPLGILVDKDSELGFKFALDSFVTIDIAANRQDNPNPLPADPNSTAFSYDFNFGDPAGIITGTGGQNFDPAYRLTVFQDPGPPAVIPLPATAPLLIAGFGAFAVLRRRRRG